VIHARSVPAGRPRAAPLEPELLVGLQLGWQHQAGDAVSIRLGDQPLPVLAMVEQGVGEIGDLAGRGLVPGDQQRGPEREHLGVGQTAVGAADLYQCRQQIVLRSVPPLRDEPEPALVLALPSTVHLPDITRCAASATASAINEPSLVALAIMLVAACDALSAASRPASRIARRALGLALIAAAAAASPAASISLLIAPLASLSTVLLPELEDDPDDLEDVFRAGLAIASNSLR